MINNQDLPTLREQEILTLVQVYKTVTAEQIAESLHITWADAYKSLLRLHFAFSMVKIDVRHSTTFHLAGDING